MVVNCFDKTFAINDLQAEIIYEEDNGKIG